MKLSKLTIVSMLTVLTACGPTDSKDETSFIRDVVTNINASGLFIYFVDGPSIVRSQCQAGAVVFDRATCNLNPISVPAGHFFAELEKFFGEQLSSLEDKLRGIYVRIQRIDSRLLDLINTDPDPARPDLRPAITSKEHELSDVDLKVADINDQIARILRDLANSEDPSLRKLLQDLNLQLADWKSRQNVLQQELRDLRQQFIMANVSIFDQAMFNDLQAQRTQLVNDVGSTKKAMEQEMDELVQMHRTLKMLSDTGFVYELRTQTAGFPEAKKVAAKFSVAFDDADISYRTIVPEIVANGKKLRFSVSRSARLEELACRFTFNPNAGCSGITIVSADHHLFANGRSLTVRPDYLSHQELSILRYTDLQGDWDIAPVCNIITPGGAPAPWTSYDCTFRLRR